MDMNRLRYFTVIAKTGSLIKASELLRISQPALSKAVKVLESELGEQLIMPAGRGIVLTDSGHRVAKEANELLTKVDEFRTRVKIPTRPSLELRIGSFEVFTTYFLGELAERFFPGYSIKAAELTPGRLEQAVVEGTVDYGITYLPIPSPELDILKVRSLSMGVFGCAKHFSDTPFAELPFVAPNITVAGAPSKVQGLDGWPDEIYPRHIKYRTGMMEGGLELCRRGLAVGYFPRFVVALHNMNMNLGNKLENIALRKEIKVPGNFDVYLIKRKSHQEDREFKKIASALRVTITQHSL
jgi:DNA-binding transcriptional LysR family regulator